MNTNDTSNSKSGRTLALLSDRRTLRWIAAGLVVPCAAGLILYSAVSIPPKAIGTPPAPAPATFLQQTTQQLIAKPIGDVVEFVVNRNDTLERIFRRAKLNLDDLATIRSLPGMHDTLDSLRPGELITLTHIDGVLQKLTRRLSDTELLSVDREPDGFEAHVVETPLEIRTVEARGVIETSLFNAARRAGVSPELIMRLANDIFGWDIDFALEIQPQDRFGMIYEKKYRDDEFLGDGQILAAEFVNEGRVYRAVRFQSADGAIDDYFTPEGKSLRKQFLRAPVDFKYVSSNFNPRRLHPILNIVRAHQGVDYSAPTGTPVRAAGDGRVSRHGVQGGYGNAIILEHGGGISTLYGHLSRFAKGLHDGDRVKQGEIIGYVGSTGAATGPHLHYEYRINGVHKNPRTVPLPAADPIPQAYRAEFDAMKVALLTRLDGSQTPQVAAVH